MWLILNLIYEISGCLVFFFFFKQKTAYEIGVRLVGSEMCIRDSDDGRQNAGQPQIDDDGVVLYIWGALTRQSSAQSCENFAYRNIHSPNAQADELSLIHISEPTRRTPISYAVFCLKKKKENKRQAEI